MPVTALLWFGTQATYEMSQPELVCSCLNVVGLYVAWIDINLIANDRMVPVLIRYLKQPLLRESACECVTEIVHKGMEPEEKVGLLILLLRQSIVPTLPHWPCNEFDNFLYFKCFRFCKCCIEGLLLH